MWQARLAGTRIHDNSPVALEAATLSDQKPKEMCLEELLRRPHVHYKWGWPAPPAAHNFPVHRTRACASRNTLRKC